MAEPQAQPQAKKGRGCFFYGCITLMVFAIVVIVSVLLGVRYAYKYARDHLTTTKPLALPPVALSPADGARVTQRVDDFKKALRTGTATAPLELNSDELDYVVRNSSGNGLNDNIHLTIADGAVHAQLSVPLDMHGPAFFGRFLNGEADVPISLKDGALSFRFDNVKVNGQPPPSWLLSRINQTTVWNPQSNDPNAGVFTNLDKIEIKDDKLVLYPKTK
jgi:hypothetical protein